MSVIKNRSLVLPILIAMIAGLLGILPTSTTFTPSAAAEEPPTATPTVTLTTDKNEIGAGETASLTAEATDMPSGSWVTIWDLTAGEERSACQNSPCHATVGFNRGGPREYQAFVTNTRPATVPGSPAAASTITTIQRASWNVELTTDKTEVTTGNQGGADLSATTNQNVQHGGYVIRIIEDASGDVIKECSTGSGCATTVNFYRGAMTRTYHAEVADPDGSNVQGSSTTVTLQRASWFIELFADKEEVNTGYNGSANVYATTNQNVTDGGYTIRIIDTTDDSVVKECTAGNSCGLNVNFYNGPNQRTYRAVVSDPDGTNIQAESNTVSLNRAAWSATLYTDKTVTRTGYQGSASVSAHVNQDRVPGDWHLFIYDAATDEVVLECPPAQAGCGFQENRFRGPITRTFYAQVADANGENVQATSNTVSVSRTPWTLEIRQGGSVYDNGTYERDYVSVGVLSNQDPKEADYTLNLVNEQTGEVTVCESSFCGGRQSPREGGPYTYHGELVDKNDPGRVEAVSGKATIKRLPWAITFDTSYNSNGFWYWTYNVNQPLGGGYKAQLVKISDGQVMWECDFNRGCSTGYLGDTQYGPDPRGDYYTRVVDADGNLHADSFGFSADTGRLPMNPKNAVGGGNPNANNPKCHCGDPVNTVSGEFYLNETDLAAPSRTPLAWTRNYTATRDTANTDEGMGVGWTTGLNMRIDREAYDNNGGTIKVVNGNGSVTEYYYTNYGQTTPVDTNITATLYNDSYTSGNWFHTTKTGETYKFASAGKILSVTDRNNETVTYTYGDSSNPDRVTAITNTSGQQLDITWNNGRITAVTAPGNRAVTYGYETVNGTTRLTTVTDPAGEVTTYTYGNTGGAENRLTAITNPRGATVTNTYDAAGRVINQENPVGGNMTFAYSHPLNQTYDNVTTTTITDATGVTTEHMYDRGWLAQKTVNPAGANPRVWTYENGPTGQPVRVTNPAGDTTHNTYNTLGNLTSTTNPAGDRTEVTFNQYSQPTKIVSPRGNTTRLTYDQAGNLTETRTPITGNQESVTTYTYGDPAHPGDLTSITDAENNTTVLAYNTRGLLTSHTTPEGHQTTRTYNTAGDLTEVTDPRNNTISYTHDDLGRVTTTTDPASNTTTYTYDPAGNLTKITDPNNGETTLTYNLLDQPLTTTTPAGRTTTNTYNTVGQPTSTTDPAGITTNLTYNSFGETKTVTTPETTLTYGYNTNGLPVTVSVPNPDGPNPLVTTTGYDTADRPVTVTNPAGETSTLTYNPDGQVSSAANPLGETPPYTYNKAGLAATVTDPAGNTSSITYDDALRPVTATNPAGDTTTTAYDADSQVTSTTDERGKTTTYAYNTAGSLASVTDPAGNTTLYSYNSRNLPTSVIDAANNTTAFTYDMLGRQTKTTNPDGGETTLTYNPDSQPVTTTNPLGGATGYTYDSAGRLKKTTDPLNRDTLTTYDPTTGRTASVTEPNGDTTTYDYDTLGRATGIDHAGATPDIGYTYDKASRVTSMTDGLGTTNYTYDTAGRLLSASQPNRPVLTYAYNNRGLPTSRTIGTGTNATTTGWTYDDLGRPATMTTPQGTSTYGYDKTSNLTTRTLPDGSQTTRTYNNLGLPTSQTDVTNQSETTRTWGYDNRLNPTSYVKTIDDGTGPVVAAERTYAYDSVSRLNRECDGSTGTCAATDATASWAYDLAGNPLTHVDGSDTTVYTYNTAGETLTSTLNSDPTVNWTYDVNGRLTQDTKRTYTYNTAGQTKTVTPLNGNPATTYTYDGAGNRATTDRAGTPTTHLWDSNTTVPSLLRDSTPNRTAAYDYHPDDSPAALTLTDDQDPQDAAWNGTWNYLTDPQGTVTTLTTETGDEVVSYDYTPYGQTRGPPAQAAGVTAPAFQPYAHAGQYVDATGLTNLRNRLYDPATGRFTSPDPINGAGDIITGTSLYAYGNLNPLAYTDPLGLFGWPSLQNISDGAAAFGDTVTFGGTAALRRVFEADGVVDRSSWAYTSGSIIGGVVTAFIPGGVAVNAGRIGKAANTAWSAATATTKARIGFGVTYGATNFGLNTWAATGDCFASLRDTAIGGVLGGTFAGFGEVAVKGISRLGIPARIEKVFRSAKDSIERIKNPYGPGFFNRFEGTVYPDGSRQGFTGVYDTSSGKIRLAPSRGMEAGEKLPQGWVNRRGGHLEVSNKMNGTSENHLGFSVVMQDDGSLSVGWLSRTLNSMYPDAEVPSEVRNDILQSIKRATGKEVQ